MSNSAVVNNGLVDLSLTEGVLPVANGGTGSSTGLSGYKNALINPNFTINQDAVSGTVTLAAGVYGHDGWKAGASGCTYTFVSNNGINTLTISAGTLLQIIEGNNLPLGSNTCVLSWIGTAQGRFNTGSYGATGISATVVGGTNLTIEFSTGTLSLVQLEKGSVPTVYEQRPYVLEMELCLYYYEVIRSVANQAVTSGAAASDALAILSLSYKLKRINPTISFSGGWTVFDTTVNNGVTLNAQYPGLTSSYLIMNSSGLTTGRALILLANSVGQTIKINARL
jgi:hypothetical protein